MSDNVKHRGPRGAIPLTVYLPRPVQDKVRELAAAEARSVSSYIAATVQAHIKGTTPHK